MAIKYEIHYLPNAGGNEETRRFAHIFEQTAMTDKEMISRIARHSCLGEGEVSSVEEYYNYMWKQLKAY